MGKHRLQVELWRANLDAQFCMGVASLMEDFRSMQQCLGGNATDIEAGAAKCIALFDHRSLQAELCSLDCTDIAARACSDDDDVI